MSTISLAPRRPVLADRVLPRSLAVDAGLVVAGAALTAGLAQLEIPLWPVPVTGQTLAVLLVGASLGATRSALSMALYAVAGLVGLPVYSDHTSGAAVLLGPTGGYIVGFVLAAAFTGWLAERRWERRLVGGMLAFVAGSVVVFLVGLPWLKVALGLTWAQTLAAGLYPFVIGGIIKAGIAAAVLRGAWALVAKADASKAE
ncbi:biotin transporter BioY [Amnibacterium sp. CER49]|uniref:biotin transporter BioY n=1 Tax=Amnibacterium sp. CER49 TaxID=3039161 RepID=UPI00244CB427|nr:biotin transporter BioY [Amnibacterium sp. CER49]MDH2444429.1 biotin transporter BioY [Amnibacterium sp. CER49]